MLKLILIFLSGVAVGGFLGVVFMCCFISAGQADKKRNGVIDYGMAKKSRFFYCKSNNGRRR